MTQRRLVAESMVSTLISKVKEKEFLWNTEDYYYNDRFTTMSAWREISKEMGIPDDTLKMKWKNLRDLFKRECKRYGNSSLESYPGKWKYYKDLWFLNRPGDNEAEEDNSVGQHDDNGEREVEIVDPDNNPFEPAVKCEPDESDANDLDIGENELIPQKRRKYSDGDYDSMYLQSLTPYFSQLDPIRKLLLRSKINDLLLNELAAQQREKKPNGINK